MHHIRRRIEMKIKCLGILLVAVICIAGCGKSTTDETSITNEKNTTSEKNTTDKKDTISEGNAGKDEFDVGAEFPDLRIGDTVCVATEGVEEPYQFKWTLNSVEYADSEINGFSVKGSTDGFIVLDITLEGVGPDVSYGIVFSQTYIERYQFYPEHQSDYGLNTFSNPDDVLAKGETVTGKIAVDWNKEDLEIQKNGILITQFTYTVEESEIKDYIPGEQ